MVAYAVIAAAQWWN